jgi:hypothetical protein
MKIQKYVIRLIASGTLLLASVLACDLSPYTTSVPTVPTPREIYVSTAGADAANCGLAARPCLTVTQGVRRAVAGSTIHIGAGSFVEAALIVLHVPVTFVGAGRTTTRLSSRGTGVFEIAAAVDVHAQDLAIVNTSGASSNAVQVDGGNGSLEMQRVNMQNNAGTAINVFYGSLVSLDDCLIAGSKRPIYSAGGLQITGNTIFRNNSDGIYTSGVASIDGASFTANGPAVLGPEVVAAVRNTKSSASASAMLSVRNATFTNTLGVGVFSDSGARTTISASTFTGNWVGISVQGGVTTIQDVVLQGGTNPQQAGLYVAGSQSFSSVVDISRSVILRMPIGVQVESNYTTTRLENVTIGDSAGGAGILAYGGNITLSYSTIVHNGAGMNLSGGATATSANSIIALNGGSSDCVGTLPAFTGANYACYNRAVTDAELGVGPLTPAAGTQVYPLVAGSRAIDAAFGECPALDQRRYSRPSGAHCDVGAYEFGAGLHLEAATPGGPTETPGIFELLPTETATATPASAPQVTFIKNGNCRKGPGTGYNIVTSLAQGQQAPADGRDEQSQWVDILVPNTQAHCWVSLSTVELNVPVETLEVLPLPPIPDAPASLSRKAECVGKLKKLTVKLIWTDVSSETGYHVYRNGTLIGTAGANVTTYMDGGAPLGVDLTYEVEAFNANGSSSRAQTTVSACK